jgi:hypothetical protein
MKKQKKRPPARTTMQKDETAPAAENEGAREPSPERDLAGGAAKGAFVGGLLGGGGGAVVGGAAGLIGGALGDDDDSGW